MIDNNTNEHYYRKKDKEQAEIELAKAKEIEAKKGKKVRFLRQGESFDNEFVKKKNKI